MSVNADAATRDSFKESIRAKIYERALADAQEMIDEHDAEGKRWAEHNPPYRNHYCLHGTNQWVDYDNICWGCEEGIFEAAQFAEMWTASRTDKLFKAFDAWQASYIDRDIPAYVTDANYRWFGEMCEQYYPKG